MDKETQDSVCLAQFSNDWEKVVSGGGLGVSADAEKDRGLEGRGEGEHGARAQRSAGKNREGSWGVGSA